MGYFDPSLAFEEGATDLGGVFTTENVPGGSSIAIEGLNDSGDIAYSVFTYTTQTYGALLRSGSFFIFNYPNAALTRAI